MKATAASNQQEMKKAIVDLYRNAITENVSLDKVNPKLDRYLNRKSVTKSKEVEQEKIREEKIKGQLPRIVRTGAYLLPILFISLGLFLVGNAVVPIGQYYVETLPTLTNSNLVHPIPRDQVLDITPVVVAQASEGDDDSSEDFYSGPTILDAKLDYTNLSNWFGDAKVPELAGQSQEGIEYILDIPELDIKNAVVRIGGTDLNEGLIQYPGTASPGEAGAPVIFGHSVLRQFYNPSEKNPRRYVSIFSTIMTLKPGDEIFLTKDGVKYKYVMRDKTEVKPEDVYILTQNYDARQLKLVTCTPEGTYLRRGVVTAQLVSG